MCGRSGEWLARGGGRGSRRAQSPGAEVGGAGGLISSRAPEVAGGRCAPARWAGEAALPEAAGRGWRVSALSTRPPPAARSSRPTLVRSEGRQLRSHRLSLLEPGPQGATLTATGSATFPRPGRGDIADPASRPRRCGATSPVTRSARAEDVSRPGQARLGFSSTFGGVESVSARDTVPLLDPLRASIRLLL